MFNLEENAFSLANVITLTLSFISTSPCTGTHTQRLGSLLWLVSHGKGEKPT